MTETVSRVGLRPYELIIPTELNHGADLFEDMLDKHKFSLFVLREAMMGDSPSVLFRPMKL